jgi:hypothetical protein
MTKGIVVLAQNNNTTDYVEQACLLAMSVSVTNPNTNISIVTNDSIKPEYVQFFDKIIQIPWGDNANLSGWKVENRWKIYHVSPYDETIVLDTDMLVLQDISAWWNFLSNYDLYFTSRVETYRGETVTNSYYRKTFIVNNLPDLYSGLYFFKKCKKSHEFFTWLELVMNNWELFFGIYTPKSYNNWLSVDVSVAIVAKILNIENEITNKKSKIPTFTHMKPMIQGWNNPTPRWQDAVGVYFSDDCKLKIGNHCQTGIFHYTEKDFLSKNILETYRNYLNVR